ncbi:hypothetical protein [Flagellimonas sp.]|uniref:hypothetical protein n=1 Tax=Flagellimonas sp. TaxID=2058762 RepID=UPI003BAA4243
MKKNKKIAAIALGAFLLMLGACQQAPKKEESTESNAAEQSQERIEPPKGIISLEESKSLYDNYTKNRAEIIQQFEAERSPESKFEVARFTAFSYEEIKQYMAFLEQEAQNAQVDISSLRFYFANYPDQEDFPDGKKIVHPRQNSIFIVPAMKADGGEYGFYIGADGKAKLIKNAVGQTEVGSTLDNKQKSQASFVPSLSSPVSAAGEQSLALNRGNSSPPPWTDY